MRHSDKQMHQLQNLLINMPAENDGMLLSELDGFIAGILVCPELIMPNQWLPYVWGEGHVSPFENLSNANELYSAVMNHYNRVAKILEKSPGKYEPIFEIDEFSDETLWELWADGFEQAMRINPESWEEIVESDDEEASSSVVFLLSIARHAIGDKKFPDKNIEEINAIAPEFIPRCITTLHKWRIEHAKNAEKPNKKQTGVISLQRKSKIGRNDPCHCGSGHKYKKCCGTN